MRVLTLNPLLGPSLPLRGVGRRRGWTSSFASCLLHHQWKWLTRREFLHRVYVRLQGQHQSFAKRYLRKKYKCEMSINDFMNTDWDCYVWPGGSDVWPGGSSDWFIRWSEQRKERLASMVELLVWERYTHTSEKQAAYNIVYNGHNIVFSQ